MDDKIDKPRHPNGDWKSTYNPEVHLPQFLEAIPKLISETMVAQRCGIPQSTLNDWLNKGKRDIEKGLCDSDYAKLRIEFKKAQAKKAEELMFQIMMAPKTWAAYAWLLERCFPSSYGDKSAILKELRELIEAKQNLNGTEDGDTNNGGSSIRRRKLRPL